MPRRSISPELISRIKSCCTRSSVARAPLIAWASSNPERPGLFSTRYSRTSIWANSDRRPVRLATVLDPRIGGPFLPSDQRRGPGLPVQQRRQDWLVPPTSADAQLVERGPAQCRAHRRVRCRRSRRGGGPPHPTHARRWCELIPTPAVVRPAPPPDHCAMPNPRPGTPNHKGSEPGRFPYALAGDRLFGGTLSAQCRAVHYTRFEENESRCSAPSAWNFIRYHNVSADPLARARRPAAERAAHWRRGPRFPLAMRPPTRRLRQRRSSRSMPPVWSSRLLQATGPSLEHNFAVFQQPASGSECFQYVLGSPSGHSPNEAAKLICARAGSPAALRLAEHDVDKPEHQQRREPEKVCSRTCIPP